MLKLLDGLVADTTATRTHQTALQTAKAIAWGFFGVRKRAGLESDAKALKPLHLIVGGLLGAALFVGVLLAIALYASAP